MDTNPLQKPLLRDGSQVVLELQSFNEAPPLWHSVKDLDSFLARAYKYYLSKGFTAILLSGLLNLLTLAAVVLLTFFLVSFIDYGELFDTNSITESVDVDLSRVPVVLWFFLGLFAIFWVYEFCRFVYYIPGQLEMRHFYNSKLNISERHLQTIEWSEVVDRMIAVPGLCHVKEQLNPLDVTNRLTRVENYLVAMFNKGLFDVAVPTALSSRRRPRHLSIFSKTLEWSVWIIVFPFVFRNSSTVRREILQSKDDPILLHCLIDRLRSRILWFGLLSLLLSPLVFIFLTIYYMFRYGEEVRNRPSFLGSRHWSLQSRWMFREFNELPHQLQTRLNECHPIAEHYVSLYSSHIMALVARFISFFFGAMCVIVVVLAVIDEDILFSDFFFGKTGLWLLGVGGTGLAICRGFIPDEKCVHDPEDTMWKIFRYTHYMPKRWRKCLYTYDVYDEFTELFEYRVMGFLREMFSVLTAPLVLIFILRPRSHQLISFFAKFTTVNVHGVGDICSFAAFHNEHGNSKYGSSSSASKDMRSKQGKVEKSMMHFKESYPQWALPDEAELAVSAVQAQGSLSSLPLHTSSDEERGRTAASLLQLQQSFYESH